MKYYVNKNDAQSAYMQLYTQIRADITSGVYPYGDRLPSKRLLAEETGTIVITAEHAYSLLCDEGYAEARERRGYFVIYRKTDFVSPAPEEIPVPVFADVAFPRDAFPFSVFAKTMRAVLSRHGERIFLKAPSKGLPQLRKAISLYLAKSKGIFAEPSQIVIGSGAEYLYGLIVQLLGQDKIYGIENPSYEKIRAVYEAHGAQCVLLPLGRDGIPSLALKETASNVLHVTPFRSFPSGVSASASKRAEYIEWAKTRGGVLIEDDFASEFTVSTKHEDTLFSLSSEGHVIYVNTFTKTIAPSMRIGYMVLPPLLLDTFEKKIGFYSCTVPTPEQYVLLEILQSGDFERHISRIRRKQRQTLKEKTK